MAEPEYFLSIIDVAKAPVVIVMVACNGDEPGLQFVEEERPLKVEPMGRGKQVVSLSDGRVFLHDVDSDHAVLLEG